MEQERNEFSRILDNAEENRSEILKEIEFRLYMLNFVIKSCEKTISKQLEQSIKNDFFYEPDLSKYNGFISWQELLLRYKKALSSLEISTEDLLSEKTTIIEDADDLLKAIDNELLQRQNDFIESNMELFEEGQNKKHEIELKLKEHEMQRDGIMLLKQNNESKKEDLQLQVDNLKFKLWKRKERKKYMAEAIAYEQGENHTTEVLNELGQQIDGLKRDLKEARYNHGGIDIQGRRIKVNFVNKTNNSSAEDKNNNTDEIEADVEEEDLEK